MILEFFVIRKSPLAISKSLFSTVFSQVLIDENSWIFPSPKETTPETCISSYAGKTAVKKEYAAPGPEATIDIQKVSFAEEKCGTKMNHTPSKWFGIGTSQRYFIVKANMLLFLPWKWKTAAPVIVKTGPLAAAGNSQHLNGTKKSHLRVWKLGYFIL